MTPAGRRVPRARRPVRGRVVATLVACGMSRLARITSIRLLALLASIALLAACAPTAVGDLNNPYRAGLDGPASVRAGGTVYVRVDVPGAVFGLTQNDLGMRLTPWGPNLSRATVTPLFELRDVVLPDGWDLALERAVAYLSTTRPHAEVEATVRVSVPEGARLGGQRVRAVLVDQRGRRHAFEFVVQVAS